MRNHDAMSTGIYAIEHIATERRYVGSAVNFAQRWRVHRCLLRKGTHHSPHLQSAWNKYGEKAFAFKKLIVCSSDDLIRYEQRLIDGYLSADRKYGFNARHLAESNLGHKLSPEVCAKIKVARAKQVFSTETRAMWSKNRTGRKMPDWFGEFTRGHRTGTTHTAETKALISAAGIGRKANLRTVELRSKLTLPIAQEILARYKAGGVTQLALAREFSLNQSTISLIVSGKRWGNYVNT